MTSATFLTSSHASERSASPVFHACREVVKRTPRPRARRVGQWQLLSKWSIARRQETMPSSPIHRRQIWEQARKELAERYCSRTHFSVGSRLATWTGVNMHGWPPNGQPFHPHEDDLTAKPTDNFSTRKRQGLGDNLQISTCLNQAWARKLVMCSLRCA